MHHMEAPIGTGYFTQEEAPASAGMYECLKSGGVPQHLLSLCHGHSAPGVILILSAIAAERAVVLFCLHH